MTTEQQESTHAPSMINGNSSVQNGNHDSTNHQDQDSQHKKVIPDRVFVGNLPYSVTEDKVRGLTPDLPIVSVEIPKKQYFDRSTRQFIPQSKGYGFITYSSPEIAQKAIKSITGKKIDEREIYAKAAVPQSRNRNRYYNNANYNGYRYQYRTIDGPFAYGYNYITGYQQPQPVSPVPPQSSQQQQQQQQQSQPDNNNGGNPYRYYIPRNGFYFSSVPAVTPMPIPGYYRANDQRINESKTGNNNNDDADHNNNNNDGKRNTKNMNIPLEQMFSPILPNGTIPVGPPPIQIFQDYGAPYGRQQRSKEEKLRKLEEGTPSKTTIFVGNLDRNVTVNDLRDFFHDLDPQWIRVPKKVLPKLLYEKFKAQNIQIQNKGIAFVRFADEANQKKAIEKYNGYNYRGKPLNVTIAIDSVTEKEKEARRKELKEKRSTEESIKVEQDTSEGDCSETLKTVTK